MTDDPKQPDSPDPSDENSDSGDGAPDDAGQSDKSEKSDNPAPKDDQMIRGQVKHRQLSARVPEHVAGGVFSTGTIVLMGNNEFIIDFVIRMAQPHKIAARVIVPHNVMPQLITTLKQNVEKYSERFGQPMEMPKGEPGARKPSIEEIYDDLKMPDAMLSGVYANGVMISHSPAEFCFDFITNFFPHSAVACRVLMSAPQVPRLLDALTNTHNDFQNRVKKAREHQRQVLEGEQILRELQQQKLPDLDQQIQDSPSDVDDDKKSDDQGDSPESPGQKDGQ